MDTTTLITGAGALTTTGVTSFDFKEKKVKKENLKPAIGTTVASTATAIAGESLNHMTMEKIHEKYSSAYVESMSDEQLAAALEQMDLLLPETTETDVKTL